MAPITLTQLATSTTVITTTTTKTVTEPRESRKLLTHPVRFVEKQTTPQKNAILEPIQPIERLYVTDDRKDRIRYKKELTNVT